MEIQGGAGSAPRLDRRLRCRLNRRLIRRLVLFHQRLVGQGNVGAPFLDQVLLLAVEGLDPGLGAHHLEVGDDRRHQEIERPADARRAVHHQPGQGIAHGVGGGLHGVLVLPQVHGEGQDAADVERRHRHRRRLVGIAIDDVGFGRSCLESLILLQPDVIKIDKRLVNGISHDKSQKEMLRRLLAVVESLHTKIIAEGIETREDLETLKELGVPYGQGFLWGQPV